jgi:hypothetical protein
MSQGGESCGTPDNTEQGEEKRTKEDLDDK